MAPKITQKNRRGESYVFKKKNEKKLGLWIQRKREHIAVGDDYTLCGRLGLSSRKIYGDREGISI